MCMNSKEMIDILKEYYDNINDLKKIISDI